MPADHEPDPLDRWLNQQVRPLPPPSGTFELITRRARRRKIRRAVVTVTSAAAVAAAVAVAVPLGLSVHLTPTSTSAGLAAGSAPAKHVSSQSAPTSAAPVPSSSPGASVSGSGTEGPSNAGYLPPDFVPSSVTWDSLSTGWVIGPAGTPGACANSNPDICTSVARTSDGGQTWQGLPAPPVGGPESATGVTGLRFLNSAYGWAFGPELWSTANGGETWHKVSTGGSAVTDLETADGRAYALFGDCPAPAGPTGDTIANCSSYTLMTTTAGSGDWTPVGGVPAGLALGGGAPGSALIVLAGPAGTAAATGYLVAPDGTLYAGPLDGSAWHKVAVLPCTPGPAADSGLPGQLMLATAGASPSGDDRLALVCAHPAGAGTLVYESVYESSDGGASWTPQSPAGPAGTALTGQPESLAATSDGTLILATEGSSSGSGGIYLRPAGATTWQRASLSDPSGTTYGFSYVGMTSPLQGVALGGNPDLHAIWMTTDGGQTWTVRPIKS